MVSHICMIQFENAETLLRGTCNQLGYHNRLEFQMSVQEINVEIVKGLYQVLKIFRLPININCAKHILTFIFHAVFWNATPVAPHMH